MVESIEFDLIICGSGLAGLRAAIEAAKKNSKIKIGIVSKVQVMRSHSVSAEGGTAAVLFEDEGDTIESHIYDTVKGMKRCQKRFANLTIGECHGLEEKMVELIKETLVVTVCI
jgi:succinate dehydrogenase/fumarate reductase flavoprotein subunit